MAKNDKLTIISMAVIAIAASALLHEGLGHGVTAWLRGDIPTELTSNHLSDMVPDRLVDAGVTLVNLAVGAIAMAASFAAGRRANLRYFLWLFAAFNLMDGAGYFLFSGIIGFGDWQEVIAGLPHYVALRIAMALFGAALYYLVVYVMARGIKPFCPDNPTYNTVARLPYYAGCLYYCLSGAFDPLGIRLLLISTIPAAFGGDSGLMWGDSLLPAGIPEPLLSVASQPAWWVAAVVLGLAFIVVFGRGIHFAH